MLSDHVRRENFEEVVDDIVARIELLDVRTNQCLLVLEDSNGTIDSNAHVVLIVESFQSVRQLILTLLVEDTSEHFSTIINDEDGSHVFLNSFNNGANNENL